MRETACSDFIEVLPPMLERFRYLEVTYEA